MSVSNKQEAVTHQQSKTLIKNMVRVSVSSICFYRDIFPQSCFAFKPYGNMEIVQLDAAELSSNGDIRVKDQKAFLLTQWLERGVFKVLEENYLSSMTFAVYSKHPVNGSDLLLEAYEFKFTYAEGKTFLNGVSLQSKDDIKSQAGKFVRNLVTFSSSLDDLPKENWITIEIKYADRIPADYEVDYFKTTHTSGLSFPSECIKAKIGKIETPHLSTEAKYHGLESLLYENLCKIGYELKEKVVGTTSNGISSIFQASKPSIVNDDDLVQEQFGTMKMIHDKSDSDNYQRLKNFVLETKRTDVKVIAFDLRMTEGFVRESFKKLVTENVLIKKNSRFILSPSALKPIQRQVECDTRESNTTSGTLDGSHLKKSSIVIDDIEDADTQATIKPPNVQNNPITYSKSALTLVKSEAQLKPESVNIIKSDSKIESTQASDSSMIEFPSKKRSYGIIKDPIQISRNWEKRRKVDAVVTQP